jgi:hypothetical protein
MASLRNMLDLSLDSRDTLSGETQRTLLWCTSLPDLCEFYMQFISF